MFLYLFFHHSDDVAVRLEKISVKRHFCANSFCLHFAGSRYGQLCQTAYGKTLKISATVNHKKLKQIRLLSHDVAAGRV